MLGSVGWIGGPALARGFAGPWLYVVVATVALVVGAGVFVWMESIVATSLAPMKRLSQALRDAAARPRDHIAVFRRLEAGGGRSGDDAAVRELIDSTQFLVRRIEERQIQQVAWIGSVVHDVKTPVVAAANTLTALSRSEAMMTSEDGALVRKIGAELRSLAHHVQVMLDAVRLEREDVVLERELLDLGEVIRTQLRQIEVPATVILNCSGQGTALGDRVLLERAIGNLVANACRYARSRVDVSVYPGLARVADDGPGLPAPLEVLSAPFRSESFRIDDVEVAGGAAGMGLFLARRVLELHDGKLVVERSDAAGTVLLAYVGRSARSDHAR